MEKLFLGLSEMAHVFFSVVCLDLMLFIVSFLLDLVKQFITLTFHSDTSVSCITFISALALPKGLTSVVLLGFLIPGFVTGAQFI